MSKSFHALARQQFGPSVFQVKYDHGYSLHFSNINLNSITFISPKIYVTI